MKSVDVIDVLELGIHAAAYDEQKNVVNKFRKARVVVVELIEAAEAVLRTNDAGRRPLAARNRLRAAIANTRSPKRKKALAGGGT